MKKAKRFLEKFGLGERVDISRKGQWIFIIKADLRRSLDFIMSLPKHQ
jgi:predicted O-methyltransferase YrrM